MSALTKTGSQPTPICRTQKTTSRKSKGNSLMPEDSPLVRPLVRRKFHWRQPSPPNLRPNSTSWPSSCSRQNEDWNKYSRPHQHRAERRLKDLRSKSKDSKFSFKTPGKIKHQFRPLWAKPAKAHQTSNKSQPSKTKWGSWLNKTVHWRALFQASKSR